MREARSIPFSALADAELEAEGPSVPPERFRGPQDRWAGHWATPPQEWSRPEHELLSAETRAQIVVAIDALPERQRQVITLRDVEAAAQRRYVMCWSFRRPINGCCCTARGPRCGRPSTTT